MISFCIDKYLEQHVESSIISKAISVHEQPHSHNLDIYNNGLSSKGGPPVPDIVQQYQSVGLYLSADTWNSLRGYELKKNTLKMCSPPPRRLLKSSCRSFSVALPLNFHLLRSFVPYSFSFKDLLV